MEITVNSFVINVTSLFPFTSHGRQVQTAGVYATFVRVAVLRTVTTFMTPLLQPLRAVRLIWMKVCLPSTLQIVS
jgi:hypothetical protein